MDSLAPENIIGSLINAGAARKGLTVPDLLIRGGLAGALLGIATSLAVTAAVQTGIPLAGALIFPVGFVMIITMGLEMVTGSFALLPIAAFAGRMTLRPMLGNFAWVFLGNLIGGALYALLFAIVVTNGFTTPATAGIAQKLVQLAEARTIGYAALGAPGLLVCVVKAVLCNWMVCMGVVMSLSSTAQIARIVGAGIPIMVFFAQGFEHCIVNMFVVPVGMLLGARISVADWWLWNQIPVTLGNFVGGFLLVAGAFYATYGSRVRPARAAAEAVGAAGDD
jgi:formate/nitrite transporter